MLVHLNQYAFLLEGKNVIYSIISITTAFLALLYVIAAEVFKPAGLRRLKDGRKPKLPPGPKGLPLLGSLLELKKGRHDPEYKWLRGLAKYGEMTTVHFGSKTWVFLNSHRVATEIINKRGSQTNERSMMPVASDLASQGRRSLLLPQKQWTKRRKVMHPLLSGHALKQYGEWQELESTQLLAEYMFNPEKWYRHHFRYANSVSHRIVLGERIPRTTPELKDLQNTVTYFVESIGESVIDWFPIVAKLPKFMHLWRPHWKALGDWNYRVYRSWWVCAKEKVDNGTAPPSFVRDVLLQEQSPFDGSEDDFMYVAMQVVDAGGDTTRGALNIMVMAALEYPEPFKKARAEIDRVCGIGENARLPLLSDMEDLRYICALAKEVLRWRAIFFASPDHAASQDFEFEGYRFPEGTCFVLNNLPLADECENPERFYPERFLDGHEMDISHGIWQFGGGRRICVGYRLAARSLFITISRLVQSIDFTASGPYNPYVLNLVSTDEPFPVRPTVRSPLYEKLITQEAAKAGVLQDAK